MSAEATVVRNFNDTRVGLPWAKRRQVMHDLPLAETVLNEGHHGHDCVGQVKQRSLEKLAVQQGVDKVKAPILCLIGPPDVGKSSLGQSVVRATEPLLDKPTTCSRSACGWLCYVRQSPRADCRCQPEFFQGVHENCSQRSLGRGANEIGRCAKHVQIG